MKNNYDPSKFEELFIQFDLDKNGFIEKKEMAEFLKHIFMKPSIQS